MDTTHRPPPGAGEERFRALFTAAYADLLRFAQRRCHPSHAEDVVADAFLVAWRRFAEAPTRLPDQRAWLFGITRGCLLNDRRGEGRRTALAVRLADVGAAGADVGTLDIELAATRVDLARAWHRLDAADQETLALTVFEDLTSPQAGRVLGISAAAYRLRLMRARRALRAALDAPAPLSSTTLETHDELV